MGVKVKGQTRETTYGTVKMDINACTQKKKLGVKVKGQTRETTHGAVYGYKGLHADKSP
jgi:hypothetical protein